MDHIILKPEPNISDGGAGIGDKNFRCLELEPEI